MPRKRCSLFVLFVIILFKAHLFGKLIFLRFTLIVLLSSLMLRSYIDNEMANVSAMFIEGRSKAETNGIGAHRHCPLQARKPVIREAE